MKRPLSYGEEKNSDRTEKRENEGLTYSQEKTRRKRMLWLFDQVPEEIPGSIEMKNKLHINRSKSGW